MEKVHLRTASQTAVISFDLKEADVRKNVDDKRVRFIQRFADRHAVKISGERFDAKGYSPSEASVKWSCLCEGSNQALAELAEAILKEFGPADAPKIRLNQEQPVGEAAAAAERLALNVATQRARKNAEVMADALGVTRDKLTLCRVSYSSNTASERAERESFFMAGGDTDPVRHAMAPSGPMSLNQVRQQEVRTQQREFYVPVMTVNVECIYQINS